jgi:hypothetical protein
MQVTRTTRPPGGATALVAVMTPQLPWYGFQYIFIPILSVVMMIEYSFGDTRVRRGSDQQQLEIYNVFDLVFNDSIDSFNNDISIYATEWM